MGRGGKEAMIEISPLLRFPPLRNRPGGKKKHPRHFVSIFSCEVACCPRRLFLRTSFFLFFTMIFLVADTFFLVHRLVLPGGGLRLGPHRLRLVNVLAKLLWNRRRKLYVRHDVLTLPKFQIFCKWYRYRNGKVYAGINLLLQESQMTFLSKNLKKVSCSNLKSHKNSFPHSAYFF